MLQETKQKQRKERERNRGVGQIVSEPENVSTIVCEESEGGLERERG